MTNHEDFLGSHDKHTIREVSEENARLLCMILDKERESDGKQENEREKEEDVTEDSEGEEDGWDKIEFTQVADLIDWGKRVISKKTKPWWKGDSTREVQNKMMDLIIVLSNLVEDEWTQCRNWDMAYDKADTKDVRRRTKDLQNCYTRKGTLREKIRTKDLEGKVEKLLGSVSRITRKLEVKSSEEKMLVDKETQRVHKEREEKEREARKLKKVEKALTRQRELEEKREQERVMIEKAKENQTVEIETNKARDEAIL